MTKSLSGLEAAIGYTFADISLLELAMVHRSHVNENPGSISNERLEFLGDAVLGWIVADYTYRDSSQFVEGRLTDIRKQVVNANALAIAARRIGLGSYLTLGVTEDSQGGREKSSILSDAFEAVIGAVYLDAGPNRTKEVVLGLISGEISDAAAGLLQFDYKTLLQEWLARADMGRPKYHHVEEGPAHAPTFHVTLTIDGKDVATASGPSKKSAEQSAAEIAYRNFNA